MNRPAYQGTLRRIRAKADQLYAALKKLTTWNEEALLREDASALKKLNARQDRKCKSLQRQCFARENQWEQLREILKTEN